MNVKGSLLDAGAESAELLYSLEDVLGYLGVVNRAKTQAEISAGIIQLIEAMGKYSNADRVYVFESIDGEDAFANTFEWCDKNVIPQINNLQKVHWDEMPCWYQTFLEGSSIIIEDIENVKQTTPLEYEMLKEQNIVAEISFPMYHAGELLGFVGMDNPQINRVQALINLLDIVGGHLGSTLSSFHVSQEFHEVISTIGKIYVAIFSIDLQNDTYEEFSNENEEQPLTRGRGCASVKMSELCDTLVSDKYQRAMQKFFDLATIAERLKDEETIATEYLAKDKNWHLARFIVRKRNRDKVPTHILYVTRIISDTKRRERDLVSMAEEARRTSEAKTEFLSGMAHDIRTPLSAIKGFAEVARENLSDEKKVLRGLEQIHAAAGYLERLADNVLNMRELECGELLLDIQKMSITDIFHEFSDSLESLPEEKELKVLCQIYDISHDIVFTDEQKLKLVLMNLLSNAVKYTPNGETVGFDVHQEEILSTDKVRTIIGIWDTGIGIAPEYLDKIFESFQREEDTRISQVRGIGLGLSLVKRCMELLGGTIQVKSEKGKGTSFELVFESEYEHEDQEIEWDMQENACEGMYLLVAEDNDLNYEILQELLQIRGITCDRAENGAVCVNMFQNEPAKYDAILMDIQMPVMDGIEAAKTIRQLKDVFRAKTIPIIAVTANSSNYDIQCCLNAGMNQHMAKPVDMQKLLKLLEQDHKEEKY